MAHFSKGDVILVTYPFTDLTASKVRPAVVISTEHVSRDLFIVPLTSKTESLLSGEFVLTHWQDAGLNITSAIKRGIYTLREDLVTQAVGKLHDSDRQRLDISLRSWLGLSSLSPAKT